VPHARVVVVELEPGLVALVIEETQGYLVRDG
jgi:hypothetical protein